MSKTAGRAPAADVSLEAGDDNKLRSVQAARLFGLSHPHELREVARAGKVRATVELHGSREWFYFDPRELAEDLERLRCHEPGCEHYALRSTGYCKFHVQAQIGHLISAGKLASGYRHSAETRAKIGAVQTIYPKQERWCKWCGKYLGWVHGSKIALGWGNFCSDPSHAMLWTWANAREKLMSPSAQRGRSQKVREMMKARHADVDWHGKWRRARHGPSSLGRFAPKIAAANQRSVGRPAEKHEALTDEKRARIVHLDRDKRHSLRAIARIVHVSQGSVRNVLAREKLR
jgi:hypothetical protein